MTSIKVKYRPSRVEGKQGTLYYQVIHNRVIRQVKTTHRLSAGEWDPAAGEIRLSPAAAARRKELLAMKEEIAGDVNRLSRTIAAFQRRQQPFTADEVVYSFRQAPQQSSLFAFMQHLIVYLGQTGRVRTSETYATTLNSFTRFRAGKDILLEEIDGDLTAAYEAYLKTHDVGLNTISFYMRILRAVYNRAVKKGLTVQQYPFRLVYTGIGKMVKRVVPAEVIRRIRLLDVAGESSMAYAGDLFLFSFYTRGMSLVDMAFLKKSDLRNGVLSYRRKKTGQRLFIEWEACMQRIVEKYAANGSAYLLPIILRSGEDERRQYKAAIHRVNRSLKKLAERVGLALPLTMYMARHSWASIARSKHIPLSLISQGMGHDSETTTLIYLTSLDSAALHRANRKILRQV